MTLADHLPPVGWADVATKTDLDHLRTEMRLLRAEFREELHSEIGGLRAEMHAEIGQVHAELTRQSRHFTTALLASAGFVVSANLLVQLVLS